MLPRKTLPLAGKQRLSYLLLSIRRIWFVLAILRQRCSQTNRTDPTLVGLTLTTTHMVWIKPQSKMALPAAYEWSKSVNQSVQSKSGPILFPHRRYYRSSSNSDRKPSRTCLSATSLRTSGVRSSVTISYWSRSCAGSKSKTLSTSSDRSGAPWTSKSKIRRCTEPRL